MPVTARRTPTAHTHTHTHTRARALEPQKYSVVHVNWNVMIVSHILLCGFLLLVQLRLGLKILSSLSINHDCLSLNLDSRIHASRHVVVTILSHGFSVFFIWVQDKNISSCLSIDYKYIAFLECLNKPTTKQPTNTHQPATSPINTHT